MSVFSRRSVASTFLCGALVLSVLGSPTNALGASKSGSKTNPKSNPKSAPKSNPKSTPQSAKKSASQSRVGRSQVGAKAKPVNANGTIDPDPSLGGASIGTSSTVPARRSAGTPIEGWDRITQTEWPTLSNGIVAVPSSDFIVAYRTPNDPKYALRIEAKRTVFGPIRLLALGARGEWVKVGLPIRPNGTVGWVRRSDVQLARSAAHIQIELATNTMRVFENGELKVQTKVAAGTGNTPTPTGLFFVKELVPQPNPGGALGPFAFGLSGFSTVLYNFAGGQGVVAIHGTNAPGKLGGDVSHGCVRVANQNITAMTKLVALGTPVEIVQTWDDLPKNRVAPDWVVAASEPAPATASDSTAATAPTTAPTPASTPTDTTAPATTSPSAAPSSTTPSTATTVSSTPANAPVPVANTVVTAVSNELVS